MSTVLVQQMQSDPYFSQEQYQRMQELLGRVPLSDQEQVELETLVTEELMASAKRSEALADALGR